MDEQRDIVDRKDIELIVNRFYNKVQADPLLAPQFIHVDWAKHLPIMYDFWASMMLGEQTYRGAPFPKHANLPIAKEHFDAWTTLFFETVDENFRGEKALEMKMRAQNIARVFEHKMNLMKQTL